MYLHTLHLCAYMYTHTTLEESVAFCEHLGKPLAALNNTAIDMGLQSIHALSFNSFRKYPKVEF